MIKMLIWPAAIHAATTTLSDTAFYHIEAWRSLSPFAGTVNANILPVYVLVQPIANLRILASVCSHSLQMVEAILALIFSIVFWLFGYVCPSVSVVAPLAIGTQTIWATTMPMKLTYWKHLATFGALFCIHSFIIAQWSEKYNHDR